jgi:3-isopropylmalate/(R)-2-methylmalate dehydratase large subunit
MLFELNGHLPHGVYSKDIILYIISKIGVDGARYRTMEYRGSTLADLSMEARFTITNMAIEAGGKNGVMPVDDVAMNYVHARSNLPYELYYSDDDAQYSETYKIDVSSLEPIVALPSLPSNGRFISEVPRVKIDQVYIGSCTNGRIEDLRIAATVMKGHKVAPGTRAIVVPATTEVWKTALREGLFDVFSDAGCVVSTATCGACLGGHMGVLGSEETCLSTTNRNFVGRMGDPRSKVYLASPATAAATAITGTITDPREFLGSVTPNTAGMSEAQGHDDYLWGV